MTQAAQIEEIDFLHSAKSLKDGKKMMFFFISITIPSRMAETAIPKSSAKLLFFHSPKMLRKFILILSRFFKNTCEGELRVDYY